MVGLGKPGPELDAAKGAIKVVGQPSILESAANYFTSALSRWTLFAYDAYKNQAAKAAVTAAANSMYKKM